jgi:hypothetical protein
MTTILTCPFCGEFPETMGSGEGQRGLMIHCITQGCVNPHVSYYEHAAALGVWNRRIEPATKPYSSGERTE